MDMTFASAIGSARAALDLIKLAVAARDDVKVQAALIDANTRLLELSMAALALSEKITALQSELAATQRDKAQIEAKLNDRASYTLHEVRSGAFVYAPKDASSGEEPMHYLCQHCYDNGVKSILRSMDSPMLGRSLECAIDPRHSITQL